MHYNFDQVIDRRNTSCVKWDEITSPDMLPLWVADMDFATAPCVQEAIVRRATHPCYGYTIVPDAYYHAIIDWFATRHTWNIEKQEILYTIGVIPAIASVLKAVCQTGDNVVILTPVYNCFFNLIRNAGCQAIEVPLACSHDRQLMTYDIPWEDLEAALAQEKSTVLLFCNPHNPAGRLWSADEMRRVGDLCLKHGITVISDEIHNELTPPDRLYTPWGTLGEAYQQQAVVCLSPSKSFNIAGLQNAFMVCRNADLRRRIDRAINLNEVCDVNPFGIEAVIAAYSEGGEWLDELRAYIYSNYRHACQRLSAELPEVGFADLQGTYLMWLDCSALCERLHLDGDGLFRRLMIDAKVWFCNGVIYGEAGRNHLRINLACPHATLDEALTRFIDYVK